MSDNKNKINSGRLIVIGASTGGTFAIEQILSALTTPTPPILIAQHMPPVFTQKFAERLNSMYAISAIEGFNGCAARDSQAIIAPGGHNMLVEAHPDGYLVRCLSVRKSHGQTPSVDALFFSAAKAVGRNAIGVILTGMGSDGAKGLLALRNTGAQTFGQDEESCVVYGMPRAAMRIGAVARQVSLKDMAGEIKAACRV